jgi:hypothetical protein
MNIELIPIAVVIVVAILALGMGISEIDNYFQRRRNK